MHAHKFKVLTVNVNGLNNHNKKLKQLTLHYYKKLINLKQSKQNGNRNGMVCPSGTRDLPTTPQALLFFLVKISKLKYKI